MLKKNHDKIEIAIKVTPKASRTEIIGWEENELKIRVAAVPEKGAANVELIKFLAKHLGIGKSQISIVSGEHSRHKRLLIRDLTDDSIRRLDSLKQNSS